MIFIPIWNISTKNGRKWEVQSDFQKQSSQHSCPISFCLYLFSANLIVKYYYFLLFLCWFFSLCSLVFQERTAVSVPTSAFIFVSWRTRTKGEQMCGFQTRISTLLLHSQEFFFSFWLLRKTGIFVPAFPSPHMLCFLNEYPSKIKVKGSLSLSLYHGFALFSNVLMISNFSFVGLHYFHGILISWFVLHFFSKAS